MDDLDTQFKEMHKMLDDLAADLSAIKTQAEELPAMLSRKINRLVWVFLGQVLLVTALLVILFVR